MAPITYFPTSHKATVENYPYGRKIKTTAYFSTEFSPRHGFRSVFQTVNPQTGKLNAPKKGTYYPCLVLIRDEETGHYSHTCPGGPHSTKATNGMAAFAADHAELFTAEQLAYIVAQLLIGIRANAQALVVYCGANFEDVKPLIAPAVDAAMKAAKLLQGHNLAHGECPPDLPATLRAIVLDEAALEATKKPDFSPFRTTTRAIIDGSGVRPVTTETVPA